MDECERGAQGRGALMWRLFYYYCYSILNDGEGEFGQNGEKGRN